MIAPQPTVRGRGTVRRSQPIDQRSTTEQKQDMNEGSADRLRLRPIKRPIGREEKNPYRCTTDRFKSTTDHKPIGYSSPNVTKGRPHRSLLHYFIASLTIFSLFQKMVDTRRGGEPRMSRKAKGKGKAVATEKPTQGKKKGKGKGDKRTREQSPPPPPSASGSNILVANLASCQVLATKFLDWGTVETLGLRADLELLFTNMGINRFMHMREHTHKDETLQFLETIIPGGTRADDIYGSIRFEIDGITYGITMAELQEIYQLDAIPMTGEDIRPQDGMMDLWHRLASGEYVMGKSKSSLIRSPVVRLAQRALGFTFFGRYQVGQLTKEEWRMLCHGLRPLVSGFDPPPRTLFTIAPVYFLVGNFFRMKKWASTKKPDGWQLCMGGILTPLFHYCGIELTPPIPTIPMIDMQHLYQCHFLTRSRTSSHIYPYTVGGIRREITLPDFERVPITQPGNIIFEHIIDHHAQAGDSTEPMAGEHVYGEARYRRPLTVVPQTPVEHALVEQIGLLQRWIKWQGRSITKLVKKLTKSKKRGGHTGDQTSTSHAQQPPSPQSSNPSIDIDTPPGSDHESA